MALKLNVREITPEDIQILRMVALRNGKAEDYPCCDVTNEDGVTQTTWYSKADAALWGEDYIRAHTTMKYSDYSGWIISLDMEPWNDAQASPAKQEDGASFPPIPASRLELELGCGIDYIALYYVNEKGQQVQIRDAGFA